MGDASLIYYALLRAERRFEQRSKELGTTIGAALAVHAVVVIQAIREELGNGLARDVPPHAEGKL